MSLRLAGAVIFAIAALLAWHGSTYTAPFGDVLGPGVFPVIVGVPAMALAASLVAFPAGEARWPGRGGWARQGAALGILLLYALLLEALGFPLATFGLIASLAVLLGGPPLGAMILGAAMALLLWALFDQVLGLPLAFLGELFGEG